MIEHQPLSSDEKLRKKWKFSQFRLTLKHFHVVSKPISVRTIQSLRLLSEKDASDARQNFVDANIAGKTNFSWFQESPCSRFCFSMENWVILSRNGYCGSAQSGSDGAGAIYRYQKKQFCNHGIQETVYDEPWTRLVEAKWLLTTNNFRIVVKNKKLVETACFTALWLLVLLQQLYLRPFCML